MRLDEKNFYRMWSDYAKIYNSFIADLTSICKTKRLTLSRVRRRGINRKGKEFDFDLNIDQLSTSVAKSISSQLNLSDQSNCIIFFANIITGAKNPSVVSSRVF